MRPNSLKKRIRSLHLESLEQRELLTVSMTPGEQLFIEVVNRARADPVAEIERIIAFEQRNGRTPQVTDLNQDVGSEQTISEDPKQPLAPNQALTDAMIGHVLDMLRRDYFGHNGPSGDTPSSRAKEAGYSAGAGENIAWSGNTGGVDQLEEIYARHQGLVESVGHRINMMRPGYREIGPGIRYGTFTQGITNYESIMAGTLFGNRGGNNFITGVAITDHIVANNFYEVGEGVGDVTITATREGTQETYTDVTGSTGGYGIQVPDGNYTVIASGGRLSRSIQVRGVKVDGLNVKVDFNYARMPTRYIAGVFFEDLNRNGFQDRGERSLEGRTAYLDFNENGLFDSDEPSAVSGADGTYRFSDLLPSDYTVRQDIQDQLVQTAPLGEYVVPLDATNIVGVNFGLGSSNEAPIAGNDSATALSGQPITVGVLQNDTDPEGNLASSSLEIVAPPSNGQVIVGNDNRLQYTSATDFSGSDRFSYTVADTDGLRSNVAFVDIEVLPASAWQNPRDPMDVNDDGTVASRDALIVIRELNIDGSRSLQRARGAAQFFLDVTGDEFLSAIDALRIIRYLNEKVAAAGEPPEVKQAAQPLPTHSDMIFAAYATLSFELADDDDAGKDDV